MMRKKEGGEKGMPLGREGMRGGSKGGKEDMR
jgi:hypothetical protein